MRAHLNPYDDAPDDHEIADWYGVDVDDVTADMRADYLPERQAWEAERWTD